jgi:hypothetical protein
VRVAVLPGWQELHAEYVYVHAGGGGGTYVQPWVTTGVPVQPAGVAEVTVRDRVLSG